MAVKWTEEQEKVITLRDRNILVSAAAGSGKTAVLVQRILSKIMDPVKPVDIDRLLIMTFTRAAAGEMRERIERALDQALAEDPDNEHLQRQMTLIHTAQITTIDGFCSYVIRNYFHLIGLDPGYRTADEGELKLLQEDVLKELFEDYYAEGDEDFTTFVECYAAGKSDESLKEHVLDLYDASMSNPWPEEWLDGCVENYCLDPEKGIVETKWYQSLWEIVDSALKEAEELNRSAMEICGESEGPELYLDALQKDLVLIRQLQELSDKQDYDQMVQTLQNLSFARLSTKKMEGVSGQLKSLVKDIREDAKDILKDLGSRYFQCSLEELTELTLASAGPLKMLVKLTKDFAQRFSDKKREKNVLDFSDMEHFALEILLKKEGDICTPSQAARELSEKYDEVLLDEYQDSNLVQEILMQNVSGWVNDRKNIFMVGDVKQSIYRFRLARPELFMEKYHTYPQSDEAAEIRIDLHKNFRSRREVLEGTNDVFEKLMTEAVGGITYDSAAALYLGAQMPEYTFAAYETGETGLRLQAETNSRSGSYTLQANGTWTLNEKYIYTICPFFADAFGYADDAKPGTDQAAYQVRSVQQLQFINWSCGVTSEKVGGWWNPSYTFTYETGTDREVTAATYQQFPYLQYATITGVSRQSQSAAERDRPRRSWKQSHDLNGTDREFPKVGAKNTSFHPIAGAVFNNAAENPNNEGYAVDLYSWFGGVYDGDNYYIKNINIDSPCYNVGVFGTTAGAEIRNIVLYSDNGGTIERSTPAGTDYRNYRCAYALGGLVGIAYDYLYDANGKWVDVENRAAEIANCAIAGYTIEDNSTNPLQLGEAVVGGLIGVSKVDLNSCSAVVDIKVNCTHREAGDSGKLTRAQYGNFVRVGGLVGGVQYKVTNCYTGGTITIGSDTLNERVDKSGSLVTVKTSTEKETEVENAKGTYVYIGGIGGSGFSSNFRNFSNKNGTDDGEPEYENCYTYTGLPTMQGTIMAISRIGSVADRYEWAPSVTITNCYYYAESDVQYNLPKYYCGKKSLATILASDEEKEKMLQGDLSYLSKYIGGRNHRPSYSIDLTKLSYEQMAGRKDVTKNGQDKRILELLNQNGDSVFGWVTVEEAQAEVHGKYSFPGKNIAVLDGQDYPFPTVLTQASEHTDSRRANLHYGDWPLVGPAWEKSSVTIDRITDYDAKTGAPVITAVLKLENMEDGKLGGLTLESFRSTNESIARVTGFQKVDEKTCRVTLEGLANGSVEITAALDGHVARLMVSVTAELTIRMSDEIERAKQITVNEAATVPLGLAALDRSGKALTKDLSWTVANAETGAAQIVWKNGVPQSVRGIGAGETTLLITASYRINETETVTVSRIVPVTVLAKAADGTA